MDEIEITKLFETINQKEPVIRKGDLILGFVLVIIYLLLIVVFIGWSGFVEELPYLFFGLIIYAILAYFMFFYRAWEITSEAVILKARYLFWVRKEKTLPIRYIKSIRVIEGPKRTVYKFQTIRNSYILEPNVSIFKFAPILKYLKEKGIEIVFVYKDVEIQMYLDGKIDSIPIKNNY